MLKLAVCTHAAAKYAVLNWHYSQRMPCGRLVRIGVWEHDKFIGCVLFGYGATPSICKPFGMTQDNVCELVRVALTKHDAPVSRIVAIAIKLLRKSNPGLRIIVSYADRNKGHHGGIYKAGGWVYIGRAKHDHHFVLHGKEVHVRSLHALYGTGSQSLAWVRKHLDPHAQRVYGIGKEKYVFPLDAEARALVEQWRKPYPKPVNEDTPAARAAE